MSYDDWGLRLLERFLARDPAEAKDDWETMKQRLAVGVPVTGIVIAKAAFGAWLDIGVGFPGLLLIPDVQGLTPERYKADDWCPVGDKLALSVVGFNDGNHQINVLQIKRER